ncbi:MAG: hypothetical protein M1832_001279 [Thelocarpon impressellum]|nr:MAG: hypothetical protein M1832_001279 [Thelocarpon impressellum]
MARDASSPREDAGRAGVGVRFPGMLGLTVFQKLWIVPQYDLDKLSVMRKAFKHKVAATAQDLKCLADLDRTNWLMLQLPPRHFLAFAAGTDL